MSLYSPNTQIEAKTNSMYLINPTVKEFQTTFFDDNNKSITITLSPLETREFSRSQGQIVLTHLANFILNEGGFAYKTDVKKELEEIKQKCIVYE